MIELFANRRYAVFQNKDGSLTLLDCLDCYETRFEPGDDAGTFLAAIGDDPTAAHISAVCVNYF